MRDLAVLLLHLLATIARLAGPGGARSVMAESALLKHQLLILYRSRKLTSLRPSDRVVAGLCTLFMRPGRLVRSAVVLKPSTPLRLPTYVRAELTAQATRNDRRTFTGSCLRIRVRRASELLRTWQIGFVAPNASGCARASMSCPPVPTRW